MLVSRDHVGRAAARPTDMIAWAERLGVTDLGLEHMLIDDDVVTGAHTHGLRVGALTVNNETTLRRIVAFGVDVITTDRLDVAACIRETAR